MISIGIMSAILLEIIDIVNVPIAIKASLDPMLVLVFWTSAAIDSQENMNAMLSVQIIPMFKHKAAEVKIKLRDVTLDT